MKYPGILFFLCIATLFDLRGQSPTYTTYSNYEYDGGNVVWSTQNNIEIGWSFFDHVHDHSCILKPAS